MGFTDEQKAALRKPLTQDDIAHRTQAGRKLTYIEGYTAINHANECFGFDGWSHTIDRFDYNEALHMYMAFVTVTAYDADGKLVATHQDIGHGIVAIGKSGETAEGHETAAKGAVTDAMKRALRCFGSRFGNDLYEKDAPPLDTAEVAELREYVAAGIAALDEETRGKIGKTAYAMTPDEVRRYAQRFRERERANGQHQQAQGAQQA